MMCAEVKRHTGLERRGEFKDGVAGGQDRGLFARWTEARTRIAGRRDSAEDARACVEVDL